MKKAEKKFRLYAILVIFALLTALLVVINAISFTMAAQDADVVTQNLMAGQTGQAEQAAPAADAMPGQPDQQMQPGTPGQPDQQMQPGTPGQTDQQTQPGAPGQTDGQMQPGTPGQTDGQMQPGTPGQQGRGGFPGQRGQQTAPDQAVPGQLPDQTDPSGSTLPSDQMEQPPLSDQSGQAWQGKGRGGAFGMGPMGPDSPEMDESLRYFTIAYSDGVAVETVAFRLSAVTEDEAMEWGKSLLNEQTGWTRGTYRYRVWKSGSLTYVTVIDQGRELLSSYRILVASAIGEALCLIIAYFVLLAIGRKLYAPIEEADRKQKNFIRGANKEFRLPLTVIAGNTELIERQYGPNEQTGSTRRQIAKLSELVEKLDAMSVLPDGESAPAQSAVSDILAAALERERAAFAERGIALTEKIEPSVTVAADPDGLTKLTAELVTNAVKYAKSRASFTLKRENGFVVLEASNDTDLPDGDADRVFDRFTTLENAPEGAGLGLALVKDVVKANNGRASAFVSDGTFTLRITL